nr:unnamed protein product [Callosobruchus chinensis]
MDCNKDFKQLEDFFTKSMESFSNRLKQAVNKGTTDIRDLENDYNTFKGDILNILQNIKTMLVNVDNRIDTIEMDSRRNVLLIHGIPEKKEESVTGEVKTVLKTLKLNDDIFSENIEECHRFGLPKSDQTRRPRPVVVKFNNYTFKQAVWGAKKNLKGTNFMITEFLTKNRLNIYNEARKVFGNHKCWTTNDLLDITGYTFIRRDRDGHGGGTGMYIKNNIRFSILPNESDLEQLWIKIKVGGTDWAIGCVYRAPSLNIPNFLDELETTVSNLVATTDDILFMGDLNIDLINETSRGNALFTSLLESVGLNQLVTEPTRITVNSQTLIDVICTSNLDRVVSCNVKSVDAMSDHELISCSLDLKKDTTPMTHTFRNYRNLDISALTSELKSIPWQNLYDATDIDNKIDFFNSAILQLQDRHIPIVVRTFKKPYKPWKTDNVMLLISLQNKARMKFKKSKSQPDFEHYKRIKNLTTSTIRLEKKSYMEQMILQNPNNVWKSLHTLSMSSKHKNYEIPDTLNDVNDLNEYYINSVPKSNLSLNNTVNQYTRMSRNTPRLYDDFNFQLIDDLITLRHLTSIKSNSVGFDGIEIKFLKLCCPFLLPIITHIINYCLRLAVFPKEWNGAGDAYNANDFPDLHQVIV